MPQPLSTQPSAQSIAASASLFPIDRVGNTLSAAYNIGDIHGTSFTVNESVNSDDRVDLYRFRLGSEAAIKLSLTGLSADADLDLLDSTGLTLNSSKDMGKTDEGIAQTLQAGVYYVRVNAFLGADTAYNLSLNAPGTAIDPGVSFDTEIGRAHV